MSALDEQIKDFLAETRRLRKPQTYEGYKNALGDEFSNWCRDKNIRDVRLLTDEAMERYQDHLTSNDRQLASESIRTYLRVVQLFRHAYGVKGNYKLPAKRASYPESLSDAEFSQIRAKATTERDRLIVTLIWEAGLQAAELLGLRNMDLIDEQGLTQRRTHLRIVQGRAGTRLVPIMPNLFDDLKRLSPAGDKTHIFVAPNGRLLTRNDLGKIVNQLALDASVHRETKSKSRSGVTPKLLRQSFAARWLRANGNPIDLMNILGHNSLAMVEKLYSRAIGGDPFNEMMRMKLEASVMVAVESAMSAASQTRSSAASHLEEALRFAYGQSPNPSKVFSESIKAVEAAAAPVVTPNDLRATLGKIIGEMRSSPTRWEVAIANAKPAGVIEMLSILWDGQTDRHGGVGPTMAIERRAGESALHLAATLVHWFVAGVVKPK